MSRSLFGGSEDDYAVDAAGNPARLRRVHFYTSAARTTEITDLASDAAGTGSPLTVTTDSQGFWGPVYGPAGTTVMYAAAEDSKGGLPTRVVAIYPHTAVDPAATYAPINPANWTQGNGTYQKVSAVVDAAGGGTHTDLNAAIQAVTAGALIEVRSDLTITAPIVLDRTVEIVWKNNSTVYNDSPDGAPTDTFASSIAIGSNGQVNSVVLRRPRIKRGAGKSVRAGKAINFHGAFAWAVHKPEIDFHADGLYFDASPYPGGMGSHSSVYDPNITACDHGINFAAIGGASPAGSGANINQVFNPHIYSCTVPIWQQGGINNVVANARVENLGTVVTTPLVIVDGGILQLPNYHIEGNATTNPFQINAGSIFGDGNAYYYNGGGTATPSAGYTVANGYVVIADAVTDMDLTIKANGRYVRNSGLAERIQRSGVSFVDNIALWEAPDSAGGAPVTRGAVRTDGALRLQVRSSDPASATSAPGDLWSIVGATSGRTSWRYRDPSNAVRYFAAMDLIPPQAKLADYTVNAVRTIHQAQSAITLASVQLLPDVAVAYAVTDFWTFTLEDWNGNVKSADVNTATVQGAQITLSGITIAAASYVLPSGHTLRLRCNPTGAPPALTSPLALIKFAPA